MAPPPNLDDEVSFISGVAADGTLDLTSFASWNRGTNPADYSGGYTNAYKWGGNTADTPGGTIDYYFDPVSNWSSTERQSFAAGLALWSDTANISFVPTTALDQAEIIFTRGNDGKSQTELKIGRQNGAGVTGGTTLYNLRTATVSIDTSVAGFGPISNFQNYGGYPLMALLHEEGHAIGLGHAGPYDGNDNAQTQQFGVYDTRLWSIMSYISPSDTTAKYFSQYPVSGTSWGTNSQGYGRVPTTWMPADILAAQRLYGLPTATPLSGGQIFGFNSNVAGPSGIYFDFTQNTSPVVTLWDEGGNNTLDLSGFGAASNINLNPGTYSSADGMVNNIAIAYGTVIDSFIGGLGNDVIQGNNDGDYIDGGAGNDAINGGAGNDIIVGNTGSNTVNGRDGVNTFEVLGPSASYTVNFGHDLVTVSGSGESDTLTHIQYLQFSDQTIAVSLSAVLKVKSDLDGDGSSDLLWQNDSGQASVWLMDGATLNQASSIGPNPGASWHVKATGDFDGDGKSDVLWQNDSGQASVWLMNGTTLSQASWIGPDPGTTWHALTTGDFDDDGHSDILWQNDSGQAAVWLMNGTTLTQASWIGPNPGPSWHIKATGDFDGDGNSDILWQNDGGQASVWLMNGTTMTQAAWIGPNPGPDWHVEGAGDFDGDGKSDVLWQNDSGQASIWLMNGTTMTQASWIGPNPGNSWHVEAARDFDGDGKSDVLWRNDSGQASVWLMSGTNLSQASWIGPNPGNTWHIATG